MNTWSEPTFGTPRACCHHDGLARKDAALIAVRLAHGGFSIIVPHRLGGPQAEQARVADVQLNDLVALVLELEGAPSQLAADLVADMLELGADLDVVRMTQHGAPERSY
jgi:hypothetical protein